MCHLNQNQIIRFKNFTICFAYQASKAKTTHRNGNSCDRFILHFIFNSESSRIRTCFLKSICSYATFQSIRNAINHPTIGNNTNIISRITPIKSNTFSYLNSSRRSNSDCYRGTFIFNKINIDIISQLIGNLFGCQLHLI